MKEFKRKRKIRRFLYSPLALCIVLALTIFVAKATWSVYSKERDSRTSLEHATEELASLEVRKTYLGDSIERLKTEEGVEAAIREQFQVAKPGEKMVVVVENKKQEEALVIEKSSLVSRFFDIFR